MRYHTGLSSHRAHKGQSNKDEGTHEVLDNNLHGCDQTSSDSRQQAVGACVVSLAHFSVVEEMQTKR
jgi:hypothetical protein